MNHYQLTRVYLAAIVIALAIIGAVVIVGITHAHAAGNPPGTTCTGHRYGKGGSKVCIRWTYPTSTVAP